MGFEDDRADMLIGQHGFLPVPPPPLFFTKEKIPFTVPTSSLSFAASPSSYRLASRG